MLFEVYAGDIIESLNDSQIDCFTGDLFLGFIMHADDLIMFCEQKE